MRDKSKKFFNKLQSGFANGFNIAIVNKEIDVDAKETTVVAAESLSSAVQAGEDAQKNLYGEVHQLVERVNQRKYNFQISSIETIQYSEYTDGGHYTWHTDATLKGEQNDTRKISFSILLNDDFEGGELELYKFGDKPDTMKMKKNSILFFPSFILHRVTPVTSGTRKALVGWVHGPNFV